MYLSEQEIQWAESRIDQLLAEGVPTDPRPQGLLALWKWSRQLEAATHTAVKGLIQQAAMMDEERGQDNE